MHIEPRSRISNIFIVFAFALMGTSLLLTWSYHNFLPPIGHCAMSGLNHFMDQWGLFKRCQSASDLIYASENGDLLIPAMLLMPIVFFWSRRLHLLSFIGTFIGMAMCIKHFVRCWSGNYEQPGEWVWTGGYLLLVLSAIAALSHASRDDND